MCNRKHLATTQRGPETTKHNLDFSIQAFILNKNLFVQQIWPTILHNTEANQYSENKYNQLQNGNNHLNVSCGGGVPPNMDTKERNFARH